MHRLPHYLMELVVGRVMFFDGWVFGQKFPSGQTWDLRGDVWPLICSHTWNRKALPPPPRLPSLPYTCAWDACQAGEILASVPTCPTPKSLAPVLVDGSCHSLLWMLEVKPPGLYGCGPTAQGPSASVFGCGKWLCVQPRSLVSLHVPREDILMKAFAAEQNLARCWASLIGSSEGHLPTNRSLLFILRRRFSYQENLAEHGIPERHWSALVTWLELTLHLPVQSGHLCSPSCQVPFGPFLNCPASSLSISPVT